jgi:hypothetical protein
MPRADLAPIGQAEANPFSAEAYDSTAMPSVHQMAFCADPFGAQRTGEGGDTLGLCLE